MMTRCRSQREVLQDGKGKEAIKPRAQAGPGAGRRRAGLRGALRGEENKEVRERGEEGRQEGRQQPQASRASAWPLGTRIEGGGLMRYRTASPQGANLSPRRVSAVPLGPFSPFGNYLVLPAGLERD